MTSKASQPRRPRRTRAEIEALEDAVITAVEHDHPVSARGVYYRCVSAGAVPKTEQGYEHARVALYNLRKRGSISYEWVVDGTRTVTEPQTWDQPESALRYLAASYRRNLWASQPVRVLIASEKDAISAVVRPVTRELGVPFTLMRGYSSLSLVWEVAQWLLESTKPAFLYQLGDHDPSGKDAWRSFEEQVRELAAARDPGAAECASFERIAVTPAQIESLHLMTRPTKQGDTRAAKFEGGSVEVDAIPAPILRDITRAAIRRHLSNDALETALAAQLADREWLRGISRGGVTRNSG